MAGSYIRAVNKMIRARGLDRSPSHAAIVLLVRDIARQMDAAGPGGASGRLQERYRGALKQLGGSRELDVAPPPVSDQAAPDALAEFMRKWKVGPDYAD